MPHAGSFLPRGGLRRAALRLTALSAAWSMFGWCFLPGRFRQRCLRVHLHGRRLALRPMTVDDDVSIDELCEVVEYMQGVPARYVETV